MILSELHSQIFSFQVDLRDNLLLSYDFLVQHGEHEDGILLPVAVDEDLCFGRVIHELVKRIFPLNQVQITHVELIDSLIPDLRLVVLDNTYKTVGEEKGVSSKEIGALFRGEDSVTPAHSIRHQVWPQ